MTSTVVNLLEKIAYLLEGPDAIYNKELTATTTETELLFHDKLGGNFKLRTISLFNSGSNTLKVKFNAPVYGSDVYVLPAGASINISFMEQADMMTYFTSTGTTTVEVFAMLKRPKTFVRPKRVG